MSIWNRSLQPICKAAVPMRTRVRDRIVPIQVEVGPLGRHSGSGQIHSKWPWRRLMVDETWPLTYRRRAYHQARLRTVDYRPQVT